MSNIYNRSNPPLGFYVYAYLREHDSKTAKAGTPFYIGKGCKKRAWSKHHGYVRVPTNPNMILILAAGLDRYEANDMEIRLIRYYGRKDQNTGILINLTNGGEGTYGVIRSEETRKRISEARKGRAPWNKGKKGSQVPWNKGKKGSQVPWNKGIKGEASHMHGKVPHNKGKHHTEEAKRKISLARKGKPQSEKHKKALALARARKKKGEN